MNPTKRVLSVLRKLATANPGTTDFSLLAEQAQAALMAYQLEYPQEDTPQAENAPCCRATAQRVWAAATELDRLSEVAEKLRQLANLSVVEFDSTSEANAFMARYFANVQPLKWEYVKDREYPYVARDSTPLAMVRCVAKSGSA
jgi:hypothetical protein